MAWLERRDTRYLVRVRHQGRKITDTVFDDEDAARLRLRQIASAAERHARYRPDPPPLLHDWARRWLANHTAGPKTLAHYETALRVHILPELGHLYLDQIRRPAVAQLVASLHAKQLAKSTVRNTVTVLGTLMRDAAADRYVVGDPTRGIRFINPPAEPRPEVTPAQVCQIAQRMPDQNLTLLVLTAAYTGMRLGELLGLQHQYLHLGAVGSGELPYIRVHATEGAAHELDGRTWIGTVKNHGSARDVYLPPFLADLLRQHTKPSRSRTVFYSPAGTVLPRHTVRTAWRRACDGDPRLAWEPIISALRVHDLRHNHRTWMDEDAIAETVQATRLGHRTGNGDYARRLTRRLLAGLQQQLLDALQRRWESSGSQS